MIVRVQSFKPFSSCYGKFYRHCGEDRIIIFYGLQGHGINKEENSNNTLKIKKKKTRENDKDTEEGW